MEAEAPERGADREAASDGRSGPAEKAPQQEGASAGGLEFEVGPDGNLRTVYKDEFAPLFETLGRYNVRRASIVEWETVDDRSGWTVRAYHDPELAVRSDGKGFGPWIISRCGPIVTFPTRAEALAVEIQHFWELLPPRSTPEKEYDTVILSRREFDQLLNYSCSIPTGKIIGKRWKRDMNVARAMQGFVPSDTPADWWLGEYVDIDDPKNIGISWKKIVIKEG